MYAIHNPIPEVLYHSDEVANHYFKVGAWGESSVGDVLRQTARRRPEHPAFIAEQQVLSFKELDELTERLGAALLQQGLQPGDRIVFQLGTTLETVLAVFACYKAGLIPVCAIPQYREVEIGALIQRSQAKAHFVQDNLGGSFDMVEFAQKMSQEHSSLQHVFTFSTHHPEQGVYALQHLIDSISYQAAKERLSRLTIGPRDVLSFQLSGGSTGIPKIIPRFHAEYLAHAEASARQYEIDEQARFIWSLPIMHNAGQLYALLPPIVFGMTTILMSRVDIPHMLSLIEQYQVTHGLSIGPIAPQLIAYSDLDRHDLSSLTLFGTMSRSDKLEQHLGVRCSNLYGITEGLLLGCGAQENEQARHFTQGRSGCQWDEICVLDPESKKPVALGEIGEMCFRGPSSLLAYYQNESATQESVGADGFVYTGDLVREHVIDGRSYFSFEGRLRDNINRGGEKISCEEVEAFISQHPNVSDAKLVAMPDELYGEKGCVYLILREPEQTVEITDLVEFLVKQGLAKFKCPERIEVVEEFPVTRVGKVDKEALRKHIAALLKQESTLKEMASL